MTAWEANLPINQRDRFQLIGDTQDTVDLYRALYLIHWSGGDSGRPKSRTAHAYLLSPIPLSYPLQANHFGQLPDAVSHAPRCFQTFADTNP